jgi:hypothetical protein
MFSTIIIAAAAVAAAPVPIAKDNVNENYKITTDSTNQRRNPR